MLTIFPFGGYSPPEDPLAKPSDPGPFPEEHYEIQKKIAEHEAIIQNYKSQQNTLSRVCQLPPEILSYIFTTYAKSDHRERHPLSWIKISHICRHFRAVALECPELWSDIHFGSLEGVRAMLTRSKGVDLVLNFQQLAHTPSTYVQRNLESLKEALTHMHRIQAIKLDGISTPALESVFAGFDSDVEASKLQSLVMKAQSTSDAYSYSTLSGGGRHYVLPSKFIRGGTPQLRHLELSGCVLPWRQTIPNLFTPSLTVLVLSQPQGDQIGKPSLAQLLNILEGTPTLRRLELENVLPITGDVLAAITLSDRVASLSQLERLCLKGECLECISLLHAISIPTTTTIKVECNQPQEWLRGCSALMKTVSKCRGSVLQPKRMNVSRLSDIAPSFWISTWDKFDRRKPRVDDHPCSFEVNVRYVRALPATTMKEICHAVFDALDLNRLRELEISTARWTKNLWTKYFGKLPHLFHIHLYDTAAQELADAMAPRLTRGTLTQVQSNMYFRPLQKLSLIGVEFDEDGLDVETFVKTLMLRSEYGSVLHEIRIAEAYQLMEYDIHLIQEVVAEVDWDGIIHDDSEEDEDDYDYEDEYEDEYYPW